MGLFDIFSQKKKLTQRIDELEKALQRPTMIDNNPISAPRNLKSDLLEGYLKNEIVYSIVNKIAETASNVPIELQTLDGEVVENHWVNKLLKQPNKDNSFKELAYAYYIYLLSIGNSYIYGPKLNISGGVYELKTMPSEEVFIVSGDWQDDIKGYKIYGSDQLISSENVIHGKLFNPRFQEGSWVYGLSPLEVAEEIVNLSNAGVQSLEAAFDNMGANHIISPKKDIIMSTEQQTNMADTYRRKFQGASKNRTMFSEVPLDSTEVGLSPVDLNVLESNNQAVRTLCNVWGVSSILFNDNSNSTFNNMLQARKDFYDYTIQPLNTYFADKLKMFLIPDEELQLKFDYSNVEVYQEALLDKADAISKMDYLTENEKREMIGYEPVMNEQKETQEDEEFNV